jgi:hypothetical protein
VRELRAQWPENAREDACKGTCKETCEVTRSGTRTRTRLRERVASFLFLLLLSSVASLNGLSLRAADFSRAEEQPMQTRSMATVVTAMTAATALALGVEARAQGDGRAIEWKVSEGGNGHWYALVIAKGAVSWSAAQSAASGLGAHLATVLSEPEDVFVFALAETPAAWTGHFGPWLGGRQIPRTGEPLGQWEWVTGEPWDYVGPDETFPNNGGAGSAIDENRLHYIDFIRRWNDLPESGYGLRSAIYEWSADCNGDGIVDYGQCLDGTLSDVNSNNIPDCCEGGAACPCAGDADANGVVDAIDLAIVLARWGSAPKDYPRADANGDGTVDAQDLAAVLSAWGPCGE